MSNAGDTWPGQGMGEETTRRRLASKVTLVALHTRGVNVTSYVTDSTTAGTRCLRTSDAQRPLQSTATEPRRTLGLRTRAVNLF